MDGSIEASARYVTDGSVNLKFPHDLNLINRIKKQIPPRARSYDPTTQTWTITGIYVPKAVRQFRRYFPDAPIVEHQSWEAIA